MKKIIVYDGIKTSLSNIVNKTQEVVLNNHDEVVKTLYTPGLFVKKLTSNGAFDVDWKPEVIGSNRLRINISGNRPAKAYTNGGAIISLNSNYDFSPLNIRNVIITQQEVTQEDTIPLPQLATTYSLYAIAKEIGTEQVDYLPNYTLNGEKKDWVKELIADFVVVNNSSQANISIDGIKICEFTVNPDGSIVNLVDKRSENRAFIRPELYDFFTENFLKHDYILGHSEDSAGENKLYFTNEYVLSGSLVLLGAKSNIGGSLPKVTVKFDGTSGFPTATIPVNSAIFVDINEADYNKVTPVIKPIQFLPIADFTPSKDRLLLGYHLRTKVNSGGVEQEAVSDSIDFVQTGTDENVSSKTSVIYFVNGLPPLPPGNYISREGIPSYLYTKYESDKKYIKSGNDDSNPPTSDNFRTDLLQVVKNSDTVGRGVIGHKIDMTDDEINASVNKAYGYVWTKQNGDLIGYVKRDNATGEIHIRTYSTDRSKYTDMYLDTDGKAYITGSSSPDFVANTNRIMTGFYGVYKGGDTLHGNYRIYDGKMIFWKQATDIGDESNAILRFDFPSTFSTGDAVGDLKGNRITGSANPTADTDLIPKLWSDNRFSRLTADNIFTGKNLFEKPIILKALTKTENDAVVLSSGQGKLTHDSLSGHLRWQNYSGGSYNLSHSFGYYSSLTNNIDITGSVDDTAITVPNHDLILDNNTYDSRFLINLELSVKLFATNDGDVFDEGSATPTHITFYLVYVKADTTEWPIYNSSIKMYCKKNATIYRNYNKSIFFDTSLYTAVPTNTVIKLKVKNTNVAHLTATLLNGGENYSNGTQLNWVKLG